MSIKVVKNILGFVPCIIILIGYFLYSYGSVNSDTEIGMLVSCINSGYEEGLSSFSAFLSLSSNLNNNQKYFEEVAVVEEEDVVRIKEEKAKIEFINKQKSIADLNNWRLPIVGNYIITTYYSNYHRAIDYYSYEGYNSNILSANNGTVYAVVGGCVAGNLSCNGGRGNYIVINHNNGNYYSMYMHLNKMFVNVGDTVSGGDIIGTMGNTGHVIPAPSASNPYGGTHLHFEIFIGIPDKGGYKINPSSLY